MPCLLALLVPLLATANASTVWYDVLVTQDQLTSANNSKTLQALDEIICAILATHTPWCHLFTHSASDCILYDVLVTSLSNPPPEGQDSATILGKTRHRNVCIEDGKTFPQGTRKEKDCFSYVCLDGTFVTDYPAFSTCKAPFSSVDVGCVYLSSETDTWCNARQACKTLNADLIIPAEEDFSLLQTFLASNAPGKNVWVGMKARTWLDGRSVKAEEWWQATAPDGALSDCGHMYPVTSPIPLDDTPCTNKAFFMCMRKII